MTPTSDCQCATLGEFAVIPMGSDGLDERFFATIDIVCNHDRGLWWLYSSRCNACDQDWLVAQEERIFDEYFLKKIDLPTARSIITDDRWPVDFLTYERVLIFGRSVSTPCIFLDRYSPALRDTVNDLRRERPEISIEEICHLLGIHRHVAVKLSQF